MDITTLDLKINGLSEVQRYDKIKSAIDAYVQNTFISESAIEKLDVIIQVLKPYNKHSDGKLRSRINNIKKAYVSYLKLAKQLGIQPASKTLISELQDTISWTQTTYADYLKRNAQEHKEERKKRRRISLSEVELYIKQSTINGCTIARLSKFLEEIKDSHSFEAKQIKRTIAGVQSDYKRFKSLSKKLSSPLKICDLHIAVERMQTVYDGEKSRLLKGGKLEQSQIVKSKTSKDNDEKFWQEVQKIVSNDEGKIQQHNIKNTTPKAKGNGRARFTMNQLFITKKAKQYIPPAEIHPKQVVSKRKDVSEFYVDWLDVYFHEKYFMIHPPSYNERIKHESLRVDNKLCESSFNYLKNEFAKKIPQLKGKIIDGKLILSSTLDLSSIIAQIRDFSNSVNSEPSEEVNTQNPITLTKFFTTYQSFETSQSFASKLTAEDFFQYKSEFIDHLLSKQSEGYKILPCPELLLYYDSPNIEKAFMFSFEYGKFIVIVFENLNFDRATICFKVTKENYSSSMYKIYEFMSSDEIYKRSSIRYGSISPQSLDVIAYRSLNHFGDWKWNLDHCFY